MRKLTVTVKPNILMKKMLSPIFDKIESIELQELMRVDFQKGKKNIRPEWFDVKAVERSRLGVESPHA